MTQGREQHVVICVDDEPEVLAALRRVFRQEPFHLLTTGQPHEALHWVGTREISLIISDHRMPAMEGAQLLEAVWRRSPSTTRVMLTSYPESVLAAPREKQSIDFLVSKPWDSGMLRRAVRDMLFERNLEDYATAMPERSDDP